MIERFNRRLQEQRMGGKTDRNMEEFDGPEVTDLYHRQWISQSGPGPPAGWPG
ncbi:hypothetical protein MYX78_14035 [Acidobacteria bacterium AH-259-G07]|nr:hypothetical protein [Acidobacteria bacterium AH-259-G07]